MAQPHSDYRNNPWNSPSSFYNDGYQDRGLSSAFYRAQSPRSTAFSPGASSYNLPAGSMSAGTNGLATRADTYPAAASYHPRASSTVYQHHHQHQNSSMAAQVNGVSNVGNGQYGSYNSTSSSGAWDGPDRYSPSDSVDDILNSPSLSDYSLENGVGPSTANGNGSKHHKSNGGGGGGSGGKGGRTQRRPSNRDEFDGPHQFLQRPPPEYIAMQERELPHLPTNLHVQEQDSVLAQVNDRLSLCAYDFVAKYQFPIPLTQDMRPVERPQDREWTEWVYLLKRLATKRRIPARVLYNGQIKQFVTILENSLEMRHAAKHQSRPLKDDRNILQLISAGIQVAKILKDASAMDYLDKLYVSTEKQIQERAATRFRA